MASAQNLEVRRHPPTKLQKDAYIIPRLFLGSLPVLKASWSATATQQRASYYVG
jgi:hypothetical protein